MKYKNIIKSIIPTIAILVLSGCTLKTINTKTTETTSVIKKEVEIKKEPIVYKRAKVTKELFDRVYSIIHAMAANDLTLINNNFIDKDFGIYNMFKTSGFNVFTEQKMIYNIEENENEEIYHLIKRINKDSNILTINHTEVNFDCSPSDDEFYGWNNDGLYLKDKISPLLSNMMNESNKYQENKYSHKDLLKAKLIELTSYQVVLTPELSFTITQIDNKWVITSIDRITNDCSSPKE